MPPGGGLDGSACRCPPSGWSWLSSSSSSNASISRCGRSLVDWTGVASPCLRLGPCFRGAPTEHSSPCCWAWCCWPGFAGTSQSPSSRCFHTECSRATLRVLLASFLHCVVNYSITLYIPFFFQAVYLNAPLQAAVQVLPLCFLAIGTAVIAAVAVDILRRYRLLILVSWVFMAVGAGVLTLLGPDYSSAARESYQVILGMGIGPFWSVLNLPLQASMGMAAGILCSFRLFGRLIGLALSSTIFNTIFEDRLGSLGPLPGDLAILGDVRHAVGFILMLKDAQLPADLIGAVIDVYKKSIFGVYWMIAGVSVVGFLISICIEEKSLEREELGRQQFEEQKRG